MKWTLAGISVLILACSVGISFLGIDWGLPLRWNPDELTRPGDLLLETEGGRNYHYGTHHRRLAGALVTPYLRAHAGSDDADLGGVSTRPEVHAGMVLRLRTLSAVQSGLAVVVLFLVFADAAGLAAACLAALVLVALPVRIVTSHFATIDSPLFFWSVLSVGALYLSVRQGNLRWYAAAAFLAGLAATTKPVAGLLVLALGITPLVMFPERPGWSGLLRCWALGAGAFVAGVLVGCPEIVTDARTYWRQNLTNPTAAKRAVHAIPDYQWWMTPDRWARSWGGWPWAVLGGAGAIACLRARRPLLKRLALAVVPWALLVIVYFTVSPTGDVRNSLTAGAVLSAFGATAVCGAMASSKRSWPKVALAVLVLASLMHLGAFSVISVRLFDLDPRNRMEQWLEQHGAQGQVVEYYSPVGIKVPAGLLACRIPMAGQPHLVHPTETPVAPLFNWYHRQVKHDWEEWMGQHRRVLAELRQEAQRAARRLTPEALAERRPDWIVIDTDSLTAIETGQVPFPEGVRYVRALLDGRMGYRVVETFAPPFGYSPDFWFPPTAHMRVYLLAPAR
ncbi:MAG: glycosyltransferase family 39 protein [Armatimonadetes bacterium]|nr:glycosyltransferase family 39 protein [Armatimonadota bacterium]